MRTPRLDAVAATGVRFTDWYSNCPVCSPSRASLLTGQYPARAGVRAILSGKRDTEGRPASPPSPARCGSTAIRPRCSENGISG